MLPDDFLKCCFGRGMQKVISACVQIDLSFLEDIGATVSHYNSLLASPCKPRQRVTGNAVANLAPIAYWGAEVGLL